MIKDELDMRETELLDAAKELVELLHRWNRADRPELVIEDSVRRTPYYHVTSALEKILGEVGIAPDEKMNFYDMITSGMTPVESKQYILKYRPRNNDEVGSHA